MARYVFRINLEHALWEFLPPYMVSKTMCFRNRFLSIKDTSGSSSSAFVYNQWIPTTCRLLLSRLYVGLKQPFSNSRVGLLSELLMGFWNSLSTKHFDRGMRGWPLLSSPQCLLGFNWYTAVGVQFFETGLQPGKNPKPIVWMAAKCNYFSLTVNAGGKQLIYSKFLPIWIAWLYLIKMEHSTDVLFPDF